MKVGWLEEKIFGHGSNFFIRGDSFCLFLCLKEVGEKNCLAMVCINRENIYVNFVLADSS